MPDHDWLLSEIQQLRKSRDRWRAVAIASLFLVFVVMLPFTGMVQWLMDRQHERFQPQIVFPALRSPAPED